MPRARSNQQEKPTEVSSIEQEPNEASDWNPSDEFLKIELQNQALGAVIRNGHRYERLWAKVCYLYETGERSEVIETLKETPDLPELIWWLLNYGTEPKGNAKAGGEATNAYLAPIRARAKRMFKEKKQEAASNKKPYSQAQFARFFLSILRQQYEEESLGFAGIEKELLSIQNKIKESDRLDKATRSLREERDALIEKLKFRPTKLPSQKTIESWLVGL